MTRQITLPLRYEGDFLDGADKATKDTFEVDQAVVPLRLNDDWALITRTKLPLEAQPPKNAGDHWIDGLSNGYTTFSLSPEHGSGFRAHRLASGGKGTLPIGGGLSKIINLREQPIKLALGAYYNAIRPNAGNEHLAVAGHTYLYLSGNACAQVRPVAGSALSRESIRDPL